MDWDELGDWHEMAVERFKALAKSRAL